MREHNHSVTGTFKEWHHLILGLISARCAEVKRAHDAGYSYSLGLPPDYTCFGGPRHGDIIQPSPGSRSLLTVPVARRPSVALWAAEGDDDLPGLHLATVSYQLERFDVAYQLERFGVPTISEGWVAYWVAVPDTPVEAAS